MDWNFKSHLQRGKNRVLFSFTAFLVWLSLSFCANGDQIKLAVFNFNTQDLEASGYSSNITNQLIHALQSFPSLAMTDRKELEQFLFQNDLQQNDNPQNVFTIGSRLGVEIIVAGKVGKLDSKIVIDCKVFRIDQKREVYCNTLNLMGDSALNAELKELSNRIFQAILESKSVTQNPLIAGSPHAKITCPLTAKPGRSKIFLTCQCAAPFEAAGYKLYRATSPNGPFTKIAQIDEPLYQDTDIDAKTVYFYKIKAFDIKGIETDFSELAQAGTVPTLEPPIILRAEGHIKGIRIFWAPNPIERPDAGKTDGFNVYRTQKAEGPFKKIAQVSAKQPDAGQSTSSSLPTFTYFDKELEDANEYHYMVTTSSTNGFESDFSKPLIQKTVDRAGSLAISGDLVREIQLKWQPSDVPFAKGYILYRSCNNQDTFQKIAKLQDPKANSYIDKEGLKDETNYFYYLTLFEDQDRETGPSAIVSAKTKGPPPPLDSLSAENGLIKKVKLQWTPSLSEDVVGYKIYRALDEIGPYQLIISLRDRSQKTYTDAGSFLQPFEDNTYYYYRLATFNRADVECKTPASAKAKTKPRPLKPVGLQAEAHQVQKTTLRWNKNPEEDVENYRIFRKEEGSNSFNTIGKSGGETVFSDTGLKNGTLYTYHIKAEDKDGLVSDTSDPVTAGTKPRPQAPQGIVVQFENRSMIVKWQANPEPDIVGYHVYEKIIVIVIKAATVQEPEYRLSGLGTGKSKTLIITAVDRDGLESDYSQPMVVTGP